VYTDADKSRALEARHRGRHLSGRELRACREAGLELGNHLPVEDREWDDASRIVLARLLRRGWSSAAIAEFVRRSEMSVAEESARLLACQASDGAVAGNAGPG